MQSANLRSYIHPTLRVALAYMAVIGLGWATFLLFSFRVSSERLVALQSYQEMGRDNAKAAALRLETALGHIYENIRTISMLPSVIKIDRHGANLDDDGRLTIQQLYNNLKSVVDVSEVYITSADFDPKRTDAVTGKPEEPILMFDELITFFDKGGEVKAPRTDSGVAPADEVETDEYGLLKEQAAWFQLNYPDVKSVGGMKQPMISGREVITCDNTDFNTTRADADRMGLVFSLPFYGPDGVLKGMVSAILRTNALRALLPRSDAALINPRLGFLALSTIPGQAEQSLAHVRLGQKDPALIFSEVVSVPSHDPQGDWQLWWGPANSAFTSRDSVVKLREQRWSGNIAILLVTLFTLAWLHMYLSKRRTERRLVQLALTEKARQLESANIDVAQLDEALRAKVQELEAAQARIVEEAQRTSREQGALIESLGTSLRRIADGDLLVRLHKSQSDPFGQIKDDFNGTVHQLRNLLVLISAASDEVSAAVKEISERTSHLANRTEQFATTLQESSAVIDEMSAMAHRNAGNAHKTATVTAETRELAVKSSAIAEGALDAMTKIELSSKQIGNIASLVEDIARQTNLLALNAAVEAARAGDSGLGFAVVAKEVRSLAQRSEGALRDIKKLIERSSADIDEGVGLVKQTGGALAGIAEAINSVADLAQEISAGSSEQATGADQVTRAVGQMDQLTQQNSMLVEQTEASMRSMRNSVDELRRALARFNVHETAASNWDRRAG